MVPGGKFAGAIISYRVYIKWPIVLVLCSILSSILGHNLSCITKYINMMPDQSFVANLLFCLSCFPYLQSTQGIGIMATNRKARRHVAQ